MVCDMCGELVQRIALSASFWRCIRALTVMTATMTAMSQAEPRGHHEIPQIPPPELGRAIMFGAIAAIAGAAVWGLLVRYAELEHGVVAWGIGGLVGFACLKARGHGLPVAVIAGALALASIVSGKMLAYQMMLDAVTEEQVAQLDGAVYREHVADAEAWVALGANPSSDLIESFIREHGFEAMEPTLFATAIGTDLTKFNSEQPSIEEWHDQIRAEIFNEYTFGQYLADDFHALDILFALLGIATAAGMIIRHTKEQELALRQAIREQRKAEQEATAAAETEAEEPDEKEEAR